MCLVDRTKRHKLGVRSLFTGMWSDQGDGEYVECLVYDGVELELKCGPSSTVCTPFQTNFMCMLGEADKGELDAMVGWLSNEETTQVLDKGCRWDSINGKWDDSRARKESRGTRHRPRRPPEESMYTE